MDHRMANWGQLSQLSQQDGLLMMTARRDSIVTSMVRVVMSLSGLAGI